MLFFIQKYDFKCFFIYYKFDYFLNNKGCTFLLSFINKPGFKMLFTGWELPTYLIFEDCSLRYTKKSEFLLQENVHGAENWYSLSRSMILSVYFNFQKFDSFLNDKGEWLYIFIELYQ